MTGMRVGVRPAHGERTAAARDRAAGDGSVAPVDRGGEIAGDVGRVGVAEGGDGAGEGLAALRPEVRSLPRQNIASATATLPLAVACCDVSGL